MRRPVLMIAALLVAAPALAQNPVVARVEGSEIRMSDLEAELGRLPPEVRGMPAATMLPLLLEQVITQRAVMIAARAAGLATDPEVLAEIKRAEEEALARTLITRAIAGQVSEAALRARHAELVAARPAEEEVRASHILVPTEAEAQAALAEARRPGADFAEVARRRSTGPGSREGGDLGYFKREDMIPEFAEAAFALAAGQISAAPVRTQFGWHVIRVEDRRAVPPQPFEEVRDQLREQAFTTAVNAEVDRIRATARIERFNLDGSPIAPPSLLDGAAPPAAPRR